MSCWLPDYDSLLRSAVMMAQCDLMVARQMSSAVLRSWPWYDATKECKMLSFLSSTAKWAVLDAEKDTLGSLSGYASLASTAVHTARVITPVGKDMRRFRVWAPLCSPCQGLGRCMVWCGDVWCDVCVTCLVPGTVPQCQCRRRCTVGARSAVRRRRARHRIVFGGT